MLIKNIYSLASQINKWPFPESVTSRRSIRNILIINLFLSLSIAATCHATGNSEFDRVMQERLECYNIYLVNSGIRKKPLVSRDSCLAEVYNYTEMKPLWVTEEGPGEKAGIIADFLAASDEEGLDPEDYEIKKIISLWKTRQPESLAELETLLTFNLLKYIHDAGRGQTRIRYAYPSLCPEADDGFFSSVETIERALSSRDLADYMKNLAPSHQHYKDLKTALFKYRELEKKGGWPSIPAGEKITPGKQDKRIPVIIRRLAATGDLESTKGVSSNHYDSHLRKAVEKFQIRHGLDPDGVIGGKTLETMNETVSQNIRQIRINMARWRWHPHELGEKYILVNIPNYDLSAFNKGKTEVNCPVIVGTFRNQTPALSSRVTYVDFNPYWNVTSNIAKNEELPKLQKNSSHLARKKIRVFTGWGENAVELDSRTIDWKNVTPGMMSQYRLRQDPGTWNALGKIKFMFPNKYDVYLHDTPNRNLFSRSDRSLSHGCIRVGKPLDLAFFVLDGQPDKWPKEKIEKFYRGNKRATANTATRIPVHITYQTSWVDKNGIIYFNRDIYDRDKALIKTLFN